MIYTEPTWHVEPRKWCESDETWLPMCDLLGEGPTPVFGSTWKQNHCRTPLDVFWRGGNNQSLGSGWGFRMVTDGDGVLFVDSWPWSFRIQDWGNLCCLLVWFGTCDVLRYLDFWRWSARIAITLAFLIPSFPNFIATPLTPGELEDSAICRKKELLFVYSFEFPSQPELIYWHIGVSIRPDRMWALSRFFHVLIRSRSKLKLERMGCSLFSWLLDIDPQFLPVEINKGTYQCQQSLKQHICI